MQLLAGISMPFSGYCEIVTMSLLELGAINFGGYDKIISNSGLKASLPVAKPVQGIIHWAYQHNVHGMTVHC